MELSLLFGAIGTLLGIIGAIATFKKSNKEEGMQDAETKTQLSYISKGVDDIRLDMKDIRLDMKANEQKVQGQILEMTKEITEVKSSAKQAHKRLDKIEKMEEED